MRVVSYFFVKIVVSHFLFLLKGQLDINAKNVGIAFTHGLESCLPHFQESRVVSSEGQTAWIWFCYCVTLACLLVCVIRATCSQSCLVNFMIVYMGSTVKSVGPWIKLELKTHSRTH